MNYTLNKKFFEENVMKPVKKLPDLPKHLHEFFTKEFSLDATRAEFSNNLDNYFKTHQDLPTLTFDEKYTEKIKKKPKHKYNKKKTKKRKKRTRTYIRKRTVTETITSQKYINIIEDSVFFKNKPNLDYLSRLEHAQKMLMDPKIGINNDSFINQKTQDRIKNLKYIKKLRSQVPDGVKATDSLNKSVKNRPFTRDNFKKIVDKTRKNKTVQISKTIDKKLKKYGKGIAGVAIGALALSATSALYKNKKDITDRNHDEYIPRHYNRGYNEIKRYTTDFGSPVKLAKTANKKLINHITSTRSATITNTKAIMNSNYSLYMNKNAIRHMEY